MIDIKEEGDEASSKSIFLSYSCNIHAKQDFEPEQHNTLQDNVAEYTHKISLTLLGRMQIVKFQSTPKQQGATEDV
jgi:hypothetical protein